LLLSVRGYRRDWLRSDLLAGLTVWAVLVPESLAYATIAGVPPVVGLYAAVPALLLYALVGSSRHLVVATMSGTAALSAAVVADFVGAGTDDFVATTAALALVVGVLALVAGLLRLGFLSSFISEPVLKGFIIGLALTIIIGQVPALLGVEKPGGSFFEKLWELLHELTDTDGLTLLVGALALVVILLLKRLAPVVPASLVVVLLGILAVSLWDLDDHGLDIVGHIDAGLPSFALPDVSISRYLDLVGPAVGVLLIGFAEGLGAARTYAAKEGYDIEPDRELGGLGLANVGSGVLGGMVVSGSLSKTAVNGSAGAKSQISGAVVAALTVVTLLFLTGLFENLPEAVLAAVVIAAVVELVDFAALAHLYRVYTGPLGEIYRRVTRVDFIAAMGALLGVLVFDTLPGLFIGISLSLLTLLYRVSRPHVTHLVKGPSRWVDAERYPDLPVDPEILVVRVEASIFFANAGFVRDRIRSLTDARTRAVVFDAATTPALDVTGSEMILTLQQDLQRREITLCLATTIQQVRDVMDRAVDASSKIPIFDSVDEAVASLASEPPSSGAMAPGD